MYKRSRFSQGNVTLTGGSEKDLHYVRDIVQEALPDLKIFMDYFNESIAFLDLL